MSSHMTSQKEFLQLTDGLLIKHFGISNSDTPLSDPTHARAVFHAGTPPFQAVQDIADRDDLVRVDSSYSMPKGPLTQADQDEVLYKISKKQEMQMTGDYYDEAEALVLKHELLGDFHRTPGRDEGGASSATITFANKFSADGRDYKTEVGVHVEDGVDSRYATVVTKIMGTDGQYHSASSSDMSRRITIDNLVSSFNNPLLDKSDEVAGLLTAAKLEAKQQIANAPHTDFDKTAERTTGRIIAITDDLVVQSAGPGRAVTHVRSRLEGDVQVNQMVRIEHGKVTQLDKAKGMER